MNMLQKWNPLGMSRRDLFSELEELQERVSRAFGLGPQRGNGGRELMSFSEWAPAVDITEDDKEYLITAELPEVKKQDVKVSVDDGVLNLTGERKCEHEEKSKKQHRIERCYGRFQRTFVLPDDADGTKVSADYKDGVLKVHLPKNPQAQPRTIDVKVA